MHTSLSFSFFLFLVFLFFLPNSFSFVYITLGEINYAIGIVFLFVGLSAGATGRFTALHITKKYNKNSLLIFMLFTILSISAILLIYEIASEEQTFQFHAVC
jgi:predicted membrane channel-forming protein YqfA (hemolysin III family)